MSNLNDLIKVVSFVESEAKIGGNNSYLNKGAQARYKAAWITVHQSLLKNPDGVVIGNLLYTGKVSKDGRPYINCIDKSVVDIQLTDDMKSLMEQYTNDIDGANQKASEYKASHQPQEVDNF